MHLETAEWPASRDGLASVDIPPSLRHPQLSEPELKVCARAVGVWNLDGVRHRKHPRSGQTDIRSETHSLNGATYALHVPESEQVKRSSTW